MNHLRNRIPYSLGTLKIKIDGFPVKDKLKVKPNWHSYIAFCTGTLLAISESMPFIDTEYNGILHAVNKIQQEYKSDFK